MLLKLWRSLGYSLSGLKHAFYEEQSFRLEVIAGLLLIPVAFVVAKPFSESLLLIGSYLCVLMAELFNSAIEGLADKIEHEQCPQIKKVKDMSSAAVFIALLIAAIVWVKAFYLWLIL